jgi:NADP-dependent 3-hydroxy acid dehydrogenase YdfG
MSIKERLQAARSQKHSLRDCVAIVTGASSGIGRATALALAREGAYVVLAARRLAALEQVANEIQRLGRESLVVSTDVTIQDQAQRLVEKTMARWERVDILVANAGAYIRGRVTMLTPDDFERALAVNFYGALYCVYAVLPHMLARRRGHIVLVNTVDGKKAIPPDAPYVSSKFALAGFGEVLRQELYATGVYVTSIFPGRVDTPMIEHLRVPWVSAKIPADSVAGAIVRSIKKREPEVVVPTLARALIYLNTFFPLLADWVTRVFHLEGWERQRDESPPPQQAEGQP